MDFNNFEPVWKTTEDNNTNNITNKNTDNSSYFDFGNIKNNTNDNVNKDNWWFFHNLNKFDHTVWHWIENVAEWWISWILKTPWNIWEAIISWLRFIPWVNKDFWKWMINNIEQTKHSIDKSVWDLWAHRYEDNFWTQLWDFWAGMVWWATLLKWAETLNKWWKLLHLWEEALNKLPKWLIDKLSVLKSNWVNDKIINLMASAKSDFATKFPMLATYVWRIAKSSWTWLKDMTAFWIVSNWGVTKEDLTIWAVANAIPWVAGYAFKKAMWLPVTSILNNLIESWLWYLWHLDYNTQLAIKENPELFKKALNWEIDHNKFISAILNKTPNIADKEKQISQLDNMFQKIWEQSKKWFQKWIENIRNWIDEWFKIIKEQKKSIWEEFGDLKWWKMPVSYNDVETLKNIIDDIKPNFPSIWEKNSLSIINWEINSLLKRFKEWNPIKWWVTYSDLVKIKQNISEAISTSKINDRSWRLLIEAENKIDNYIKNISDEYKNLSLKYKPIIDKYSNFIKKFINNWENKLVNDKQILNLINDKNKLNTAADIMWITPKQLEKEINFLHSLNKTSAITSKNISTWWQWIKELNKINIHTEDIKKAKELWKDIYNKEKLIWWDLKALTLDKLSKLKSENDVREEFAKILKWDNIDKKIFIQWVKDNFWNKFTEQLKTLSALEWITKYINWWSSIASNALNAKVLAKWAWMNLWDSQSLILWQMIKNPLTMSKLFTNYVRWIKWDVSLSKSILNKIEKWTHLNDKELQFVANAIIYKETHNKQ